MSGTVRCCPAGVLVTVLVLAGIVEVGAFAAYRAVGPLTIVVALLVPAALLLWTRRLAVLTSAGEHWLSQVRPGQWLLVDDAPWIQRAAMVLARFDDHSRNPGPVISLALSSGRVLDGLGDQVGTVATLRHLWPTRRLDAEALDSTLRSQECLVLMARAFDARDQDGGDDSLVLQDADLADADRSAVRVLGRLHLLAVNKREHSLHVRRTGTGEIWVLAQLRRRGVELVDGALPPDRDQSDPVRNAPGATPGGSG